MTAQSWRRDAACADHPHPQLFDFSLDGECPWETDARHDAALAVCRRCPVIDDCLAYALTARPRVEGVWGGQLFERPRREAEHYSPGRVEKHDTEAGYKAHRRRGEPACTPCLEAARRAKQDRTARQKRAAS